jgi:PAS domain S-box-containing protein
VVEEISARKKSEEAVRESEERFRVLFEQSPIGGMIVGEGAKIVDCNEVAAQMLGYSKAELLDLRISDFDLSLSAEEIAAMPAEIDGRDKLQFETRHRTKSGEVKNVLVVSTEIQIEGKKYGYASFLDITDKKRAEEELRREKERLEKTALASPGVLYSFRQSADGKPSFPFASPAIFGIYGKKPEELEKDGSVISQLIHPEDMTRIEASCRRSAETMSLWYDTWRVNHPLKGEIWVEGYSTPAAESDGSIVWHGVLNDVTDRIRRENELAGRERLITAINNAAPNLIILWDVRAGKISYVNESIRQIFGYTPEEIYQNSHEELFGRMHPEDLPSAVKFTGKLRSARDGEVLSHEYRYRNNQGDWRLLRSQDTVFERDAHGRVVKTLSVIEDITARQRGEEALRESEERYALAVEGSKDGVWDWDLRTETVYLSPRWKSMLGYADDELPGHYETWTGNLHPDDAEAVQKRMDGYLKREFEDYEIEYRMRHKDGSYRWILARGVALFDDSGEPYRVAGSHSDITERKYAEEALRKSEEQLLLSQKLESVGRLAGGIAHDFNNMLTAINGYSDLILRQIEESNPLRRNVEEIKKAGDRSAALTQQLLAFSRKQILKPEILNINQTVADISTLLERLIGEDVSLMTLLDYDVREVKVDPGQLSQVILNLAVNSRDAMPKGGTLTIETRNVSFDEHSARAHFGAKVGEYVMLSVSDTGVGIDEETMKHLFEPFFTTKEIGRGTGLGLATVYGIVKQSEGYITVESRPGAGATFRVYLPRAEAAAGPFDEEHAEAISRHGAETILLVEDEEMVRNLAREILQSCGYRVVEAFNGVEALEICEKNQLEVDLLLTDVVMPQMNGRELSEKLAENRPQLKVLFTSGYTDDTVVRNGVKNDETNFLQKPFSLDALVRKVREVLDAEGER